MSQLEVLQSAMDALRARVTQAMMGKFDQRVAQLEQAHGDINAGLTSPYLDQFESYYRRKLALGQLTLQQIFQKVDDSVFKHKVPDFVKDHIKAHILLNPPSSEEVETAVAEEVENEALKSENAIQDALDELLKIRAAQKQARQAYEQGQKEVTIVQELVQPRRQVSPEVTLVQARERRQPYVIRQSQRFTLFLDSRSHGHKYDREKKRFSRLDKNDKEAIENTRARQT